MNKINNLKMAMVKDEKNRLLLRNNLRYIRNYLGLTEKQLGEKIGVTKQTINNFENKKCVISGPFYIALLDAILSVVNSNSKLYDKELVYKMLTKEITSVKTVYDFKD